MGYTAHQLRPLFIGAIGFNPSDSTNYYLSNLMVAPTTTPDTRKLFFDEQTTIRKAIISWSNDNNATDEDTSIYIRLNNTTDYLIYTGTIGDGTGYNSIQNLSLSVPISKGDYIEIKIVTPAWITNPTNTRISGNLFID